MKGLFIMFWETVFIVIFTFPLLKAFWDWLHHKQKVNVDEVSIELTNHLYDVVSDLHKVNAMIYDVKTLKSNQAKTYQFSWFDQIGELKTLSVLMNKNFLGRSVEMKQLRKLLEQFRENLLLEYNVTLNKLYKHHSRLNLLVPSENKEVNPSDTSLWQD